MLRAFALAVLLGFTCVARAQSLLVPLPGDTGAVPVGPYAEVLEDAGGALTLKDVSAPERAGAFRRIGKDVPNFGYTYSAFWLRFGLPAREAAELSPRILFVEVRFPSIDHLELHVPYRKAGGALEYAVQRGGDMLPWNMREVKHRHHVFSVPTAGLAETPAYLRVQTRGVLTVPVYLSRPAVFARADRAMYAAKAAKGERYAFFASI